MRSVSSAVLLSLLLGVSAVSGCASSRSRAEWSSYPEYQGAWSAPPADEAPTLALAADVVDADKATAERRARKAAKAEALVADVRAEAHHLDDVARAIQTCHRAGSREAAQRLVDEHPRVVTWDAPDELVVVSAVFDGASVELGVTRREPSSRSAIAVVFPPGTYAVPERGDPTLGEEGELERLLAGDGRGWTTPEDDRRWGEWPEAQDLAFLRAPVVILRAGEVRRTITVPVACASFTRGAPVSGQRCALARFEPGSPIDRLLVGLCAEGEALEPAEAQLAVWLARDDIGWQRFAAEGGDRGRLVTFGSHTPVRAHHAQGAARLLLRAGLEPSDLRFFGGEGLSAPQRAAEPAPAPPAAPVEGEAPAPAGSPDAATGVS
jgi:hypothetical protein